MPRLKDMTSLEHLQNAIRDRSRWIFISSLGNGHRALADLAYALAVRWELLGVRAEALLGHGFVDFCNGPTGHRGMITILTVPNSALSVADVNSFLGCMSPAQHTDGSQDLIGICADTKAGRQMLTRFLQTVHEGGFRVWTPQEN